MDEWEPAAVRFMEHPAGPLRRFLPLGQSDPHLSFVLHPFLKTYARKQRSTSEKPRALGSEDPDVKWSFGILGHLFLRIFRETNAEWKRSSLSCQAMTRASAESFLLSLQHTIHPRHFDGSMARCSSNHRENSLFAIFALQACVESPR